MSRDLVVVASLVVAFAALCTAHVATCAGLASRRQLGKAALAFLVPPLAPPLAWRAGMRGRATAWLASASLYAVAVVLARS